MKTLLVLLILTTSAYAATYTITTDIGGSVYEYGRRWAQLRKDFIVIAGHCYSSCTMVLGNHPNVCVTKNSTLGFHRAYYWTLFGYVTDPVATEFMWSHYPPDIQAILTRKGGLLTDRGGWWNPKLLYLKGSQLPARYHCK
jgi:hypothetical protein